MNHSNFAFKKRNFTLLAIGVVIVVIGFVMMAGGGSNEQAFDPSIFNATRIKVAPLVSLFGFLFMLYAIMYKAKNEPQDTKTEDNLPKKD